MNRKWNIKCKKKMNMLPSQFSALSTCKIDSVSKEQWQVDEILYPSISFPLSCSLMTHIQQLSWGILYLYSHSVYPPPVKKTTTEKQKEKGSENTHRHRITFSKKLFTLQVCPYWIVSMYLMKQYEHQLCVSYNWCTATSRLKV